MSGRRNFYSGPMVLSDEVTRADTNEVCMSGSGPMRELNRTQKVEAAYQNEYLTRRRVEHLERSVGHLLERAKRAEVLDRGFWGRLRWLLTGR